MQPFGSYTKKWDNFSRLDMFIEYAEECKSFKLLDAEKHNEVLSKDVMFDEIAQWSLSLNVSDSLGSTDNFTHLFVAKLK